MAARYAPHRWEDGSLETPVSAARLSDIENGIFDAHVKPRGSISATTIPAVATGTVVELGTTVGFTAMTFAEDYDSEGWHPGASMNPGNVRIGLYGLYLVTAQIKWPVNATGTRYCTIASNGGGQAVTTREKAFATDTHEQCSSCFALATIGQRFGIMIYQTSGGNLTPTLARLTWSLISYG